MEIEKEKAELFIFWHILMERFLLLTMLLQASTITFTRLEIWLKIVVSMLFLDHPLHAPSPPLGRPIRPPSGSSHRSYPPCDNTDGFAGFNIF